jgi:putative membrane protein
METNKDGNKRISDHLANERTFLAWIRTSIGIMAFGFVVVRFSLFIRQLTTLLNHAATPGAAGAGDVPSTGGATASDLAKAVSAVPGRGHSAFIGIVLVASGLLTTLFAFIRFRKTQAWIESGDYRTESPLIWLVTAFILLVSVLLIIYLLQITV